MPTIAKEEIGIPGRRVLSRFNPREEPFPDAPNRTLDPAAVEAEIDRLERENERAAAEYEVWAVALSQAEHTWKLAEAQTIADGHYRGVPVSASKCIALANHPNLHRKYADAKSALNAIDKRCRAIQNSLDAVRTLNANCREQTG